MNKSTREFIEARGVRVHNLKNISIKIPQGKLVVVTGLSGSGKSSLAFDTLYAEGQRRYVESLSSYARQFLGRMSKPEVDYVKGIPPAIAIEQKVNTRNSRSTVGTSTEIYDYLKLLYARIGDIVSPTTGEVLHPDTIESIVDFINSKSEGIECLIMAVIHLDAEKTLTQSIATILQQGFSRVEIDGKMYKTNDLLNVEMGKPKSINLIIDRLMVKKDQDTTSRLMESVEAAYYEGKGKCLVRLLEGSENSFVEYAFSKELKMENVAYEKITADLFAFNNPLGACPTCEGFGKVIGISKDLVIPDSRKSVAEDGVLCWRGEMASSWRDELLRSAHLFKFPVHQPIADLTKEQQELLWTGNKYFGGINAFFKKLEAKMYKIQNRVLLARYRGKTDCPDCLGTRLKKETSFIRVGGKSIQDLVLMSITDLRVFFEQLTLDENKAHVANRLLLEINSRLSFLYNVGLQYLTLNRLSSTLSGGESQRINLSTSLGSSLVGSLYILDEPSIGLHSRDTEKLITVLRDLQQQGNTVLVVEHDKDIMMESDHLIDIGPLAGSFGGELVYEGSITSMKEATHSLTADYLFGRKKIPIPLYRRPWNHYVEIVGATENNLKQITVKFPLNVQTVVTGVSGSGKTTLVKRVFYPALKRYLGDSIDSIGKHDGLVGDMDQIASVEFVDQNPIGRSSRSNPATYIKAYDEIRKLFSEQRQSKFYGFSAGAFSFNTVGGRCEECQGEGTITVEMQFMADLKLTCETCKGKRFKGEVLEVKYNGKNIDEVLNMTVDESILFFSESTQSLEKKIIKKLQPLQDVGLGYIKLGQSSSTLSGGESQRVKLAFFLSKETMHKSLFIFDEPTTGLHFHDINTLQKAFNALLDKGHTVLIIEHNLDVVRSSDWVIDLGLEGGDLGGNVLFEGTPEQMLSIEHSHTAVALRADRV